MEARVGFRDTFGLLAVLSGEESADTLGEGGEIGPDPEVKGLKVLRAGR